MTFFTSRHASEFHEFVNFKRNLGYRYGRVPIVLRQFDRFLNLEKRTDLEQAAVNWIGSRPKRRRSTVANELSMLRQLFAFLHRRDPRRYSSTPNLPPTPKGQDYQPYIFSEEEVRRLVRLAEALDPPEYRSKLYPALILLLYGTGIRSGEALRLRIREVDMGNRVLFVADSKGRSRWVPFHPSLSGPLERYLCFRRWLTRAEPDDGFFAGENERNLAPSTAGDTMRELFYDAGLKPRVGRTGPRPTDFRHTFAVHRLTQWYREGVDLHARLPWLSAYMGHLDILGTEKYLTATSRTPEHRQFSIPRPRPRHQRQAMTRKPNDALCALVQSYFQDHLARTRGASAHTARAYGNALRLFFLYLSECTKQSVANLCLDNITAERVVAFLSHLESGRSNVVSTRNSRRAAIRGFVEHLLRHDLSRAEQYRRILSIPTKRAQVRVISYLEPVEVRAIIAQADQSTATGRRDHALLLFLYNTGTRIAEALAVRLSHLQLRHPREVQILGKGGKHRICPLWPETTASLGRIISPAWSGDDIIFRNARGGPLTRDGAAYLLEKYARRAVKSVPHLRDRRVTPHVLRHSCAVALLQAGVDVSVIRDYLGHASVATTSRYLSTNLKMKREALDAFWKTAGFARSRDKWRPSDKLLSFLSSL